MEQKEDTPPPSRKKRRRRRVLLLWILADVIVVIVILALLFHNPAGYRPNKQITGEGEYRVVPRYWTYLSSQIYNQAQLGMPFTITLDQERVNEAIAQAKWPQRSDQVALYAPTATFANNQLTLMGPVEVSGTDLVITTVLIPIIDANGLAQLDIDVIRIGALNVTPVAKLMIRKAYQEQVQYMLHDQERIENKILASLLANTAFDPIITIRNIDRRVVDVRIEGVELDNKVMRVRLTPVSR